MPIYLKHERHGTKVACSEAEAKYDESLGWERYTLEKAQDKPVEPVTNVVPIEAPAKRKYTRRA